MTRKLFPRKFFSQLTFFVLIILAVTALAQSEKPAAPADLLVKVNVIVTDRDDRVVEEVRKEDLQLTEEGAGQSISYFARDERPVTCGFVIDASGSVRRILGQLIDSAKLAAAGLREGDEAFVARFVDRDIFQIKQELTGDLEAVADTLDDIYVEGGQTALHDAVDKALKYLEDNHSGEPNARRQILILVTDGEDRASRMKDSKEILARLPGTSGDGRRLLVRHPKFVHRHARHCESEQRRRLAESTHRHRSARPLHLAAGRRDRLHDVATARAAVRNDSHRSGRDVWLRSRRDCDHAQRFRVARDRFDGNGFQTRRRDTHHDAGLPAHVDHAATARTSRRSRAQAGEDSDSAKDLNEITAAFEKESRVERN
jgi:hypothetical protein